jgi:Protein of unknown function (DUF3467)
MNPSQPGQPNQPNQPGAYSQEIRHSQVSARVPEKVGRGVFSTGAVILQGPHEFIVDFLLRLTQPQQLAARVVLPVSIMPSFIAALRENLNNYQARFGPPPALPPPPPGATPLPIAEVYDQLKLADETLAGAYANTVMIVHTPAEFCFDFITSCFPRPVVSCRVFLAAAQVPALLTTLTHSYQQYQQKIAGAQQQPQPPPPQPPPTDS